MNIKLLRSLPVAALFFAVAPSAEAMSFTTFEDRAAFEANVGAGNFAIQDFNQITNSPDFRNTQLRVGDVTFSDNSGFRARVGRAPKGVPTLNINDTPAVQLSARSTDGATLSFDAPRTFFGATFAAISNGERDTRIVFDEGTNLAVPFQGAGGDLEAASFFGFVTDSPFASFSFRRFDAALADGFVIDDIVSGAAVSGSPSEVVPTPALLPGLFGMGVAAWRKRKQSQANGTPADAE